MRVKRLVALLGSVVALAGTPAWALEDRVVVVTSYPQEVVSRFEAAFEKSRPGTKMEIVWRMPHDALPYLLGPERRHVDVYWSASPRNYMALRDQGALRPIAADRAALPVRIGNTVIADPQGWFLASEVAGYGMAVNPDYLKKHGLPMPRDWSDLANPVYAGHLNVPVASEVGFFPGLMDLLLQTYGWAEGWALLGAIAGNGELVSAGTFVTDEVARGVRGIGLTLDFFPAMAAANGASVGLVYPPRIGYSPAHVAITDTAPHPDAAKAFVDFLLSDKGQRILFHPDIRKLPVRPSAYAEAPQGYHNPFAAPHDPAFTYDLDRIQARRDLDVALFSQMIAHRHAKLKAVWAAVHAAEKNAAGSTDPAVVAAARQARALATAVPVTPEQAQDPAFLRLFAERGNDPEAGRLAAAEEARWSTFFDRSYDEALAQASRAASQR